MSLALDSLIVGQRRYLELRAKKAALEDEVKEVGQRIDTLQASLAELMSAIGQTSTTVDGMKLTVRTTPRIGRAPGVTSGDLCEMLKGGEFDFLVKPGVNANTLQAVMKEVIAETGELPVEVAPLLKVWDQTVVAVSRV